MGQNDPPLRCPCRKARAVNFPWHSLHSIIGGLSAIDVPQLDVDGREGAVAFLACYGFDWELEAHRDEVERIRREAVAFIEGELLDAERMPAEIREQTDVPELLVWASSEQPSPRRQWTCALLRVMHTAAHCSSFFNERYASHIREQVLARFEPHLRLDEEGLRLGDDDEAIALVDFEIKPVKPARSVIMKLLHKPENVAADVFDRVGVRFVTRDRLDALLVAHRLRQKNIVMFANVKPSRSRNTLIDLEWFEAELERLKAAGPELPADWRTARDELRRIAERAPAAGGTDERSHNPFSSSTYRAIQFTCRQMIRVPAPNEERGEVRFFFPFEVQILDEESHRQSRAGRASHARYKHRQREAVRRRVLGGLVDVL